jgi:GH25 family lysozyme M1 (1,4-beta-N-acetylmuramidase)
MQYPAGSMAKRARRRRSIRRRAAGDERIQFTVGIDVSRHQGAVNWTKVAAAGIRFAYLKATEGATFTDRRFAENWQGTAASHVQRGAYHFYAPATSVARQFDHFKNTVVLSPGDLAPALDLEVDGQNWSALPAADRVPTAIEFLERLEEHYGVTPIVYTNKRTVDEIFAGKPAGLTKYPLWVASYKSKPPPTMPVGWSEWRYWQHSDDGVVDGIAGPVDLNLAVGTPGPMVVEAIAPADRLTTAESGLEVIALQTEDDGTLAAIERIWRTVHEERARLSPGGIAQATVNMERDRSGRLSVSIQVRAMGAPAADGD